MLQLFGYAYSEYFVKLDNFIIKIYGVIMKQGIILRHSKKKILLLSLEFSLYVRQLLQILRNK